ncbi:MAG: rRNA (cytidine1402-2-O)-methyltransferase [Frankiaceae bacterium]|nr:rRNA (cytidine1402-2-O)-methyltransferase [Frankiaceae bacterium]MDX6225990.1 rRNA (cytidine1402-2-O)-methyltransferase [Frankiales bacterium]
MSAEVSSGVLVLAGAPLGNPRDASPRLADELGRADVIAAEDTRRFARLRAALGVEVSARVVSYFEANEQARTDELLVQLAAGARVVLVTDAGMPSISDPGYRLVSAALAAGHAVTCAPGPSAVTTALALSGLAVDRFCFEGFLPRKAGERRRRLAELADEERTLVLFEAPHRTQAALADLAEAFGATRPAAVCRELTKTYEEVRRAPLGELVTWAEAGVRGEVTIVVAGAEGGEYAGDVDLAALVADRVARGEPRKTAIGAVSAELGVPKKTVYAAVVDAKHQ